MGQLIELPIRRVTPEVVGDESFHAYALPSPVSSRRLELEIPIGGSVADVIKAFGIPPGSEARVCVQPAGEIESRIVAVDERESVFPKVGDVVTIRIIPGSISASLAATLVAAGMSAATAATVASVAVTVVVGAVTSLVGKLISMALAPPSSGGGPKVSATPRTFSVSGKQNVAAPFSPIPKFLGIRQAAPQYAATPYIELVGGDQYLRMLLLLGYGPVDISQLKIKDNPIEGYQDVEWELRAGFPDDSPPRLYPGSVVENDITVVLNSDHAAAVPTTAGEQVQTSGVNADELSVVVQFLNGFAATDSTNGNAVWIQMHLKIRWGPTGTTPGSAGWVDEPDIVLSSHGKGHVRRGHTWRVPRGQYDVGVQVLRFAAANGDWSKLIYQAVCTWTSITTIRAQAPFAMGGLAMIALRIRASRQLNGVIDALNCVASSILPDYNAMAPTDKWKDRAGAWSYDYDNPTASPFQTIIALGDGDFSSTNPVAYVSDDGGATFAPIALTGAIPQEFWDCLIVDPTGANIIAGEDSIYVSIDGARTLVRTVGTDADTSPDFFGDTQNPSNVFTPTGRAILVGSHDDVIDVSHAWHGLVKYADAPYSGWTNVLLDAQNELAAVACAPDGTLVAGSYGNAAGSNVLYRSTDNGASWAAVLAAGAHGGSAPFAGFIYVLHNGSYFLAIGYDGVTLSGPYQAYKSTTGAMGTWSAHDLPSNLSPADVVYQRLLDWDPTTAKWYFANYGGNQVYSSSDGQDFSTLEIDNSSGAHSGDSYFGVLIINGKVYIQGTTPTGFVFYRRDAGGWVRIDLASPFSGNGGGLVGNASRLCFGTSDGHWYYSDDEGATWTLSASSMPGGTFSSMISGLGANFA